MWVDKQAARVANLFAAELDSARPILTYVLVDGDELVAANGFVLVVVNAGGKPGYEDVFPANMKGEPLTGPTLVPAKALGHVAGRIQSGHMQEAYRGLTVTRRGEEVLLTYFSQDGGMVMESYPIPSGTYPDYKAILPPHRPDQEEGKCLFFSPREVNRIIEAAQMLNAAMVRFQPSDAKGAVRFDLHGAIPGAYGAIMPMCEVR